MHIHTLALAAAGTLALIPAAASAASLAPPVVTEKFTPLPCHGAPANRTTIEMEGCAERLVLARDKTINRLNRQVFSGLPSTGAQRAFIASNTAWLQYRNAFCTTASGRFAGGTEAPVVAAQCDAQLGSEHITDLKLLLQDQ
jgi:uncharacterized protein YecT (DUF1311 family)